jgi:Na+-transporting NADH:ubiquinone oxidoreductase subunit NqrC
MASSTFAIPQNMLLLIIAVIALITIIIVTIQWRRVRETQNNAILIEKQIELKKISMVEKDMDSKRLLETAMPLPKDQQEKLTSIRRSTSDTMHEIGYLHSEVSERLARLEAQTEFRKLQKMLNEIEAKEFELEKTLKDIKKH